MEWLENNQLRNMKMTRITIWTLIATAAILTGCGDTNRSAERAAETKTAAAAKAVADTEAAAAAKIAADQKSAAAARVATDKAAADTKAAADAKTAAEVQIAADLKAAGVAKASADKAAAELKAVNETKIAADLKAAADAKDEEATGMLVQFQQYIKDGSINLAEATLVKLEAMRDSVSSTLQEKIKSARAALAKHMDVDEAR